MSEVNFGFTLLKGATAVGELTSLTPPKLSTGKIERTHHGSPAHEFMSDKLILVDEFQATITASGSVMNALLADLADGSIDFYTITYPGDVDPWIFRAFVREVGQPEASSLTPGLLSLNVMFVPTPNFDLGSTELYST